MSGFFGQQALDQVRAASDIVEIIQWLNVPLKKAGTAYKTVCPFHKEKTPSFTVSPQRQTFHCFGCNAGGDVFKFVMLREGLDFPSAVRRLAERARIALPESAGNAGPGRDRREQLLALYARVAEWYHTNLMRSRGAEAARRYLKERAFGAEVAKKFRLGYAHDSWSGLIDWTREQGLDPRLLEEGGLTITGNKGPYDRFRDRLMIPIADESGRVVGFSGRVLSANSREGKYVNSPETAIFKKGRLLFGLDRAKRALLEHKTALICEGQLDWIRCFEAGLENVIAPQGTAFTDDQARILSRYVEEVILCFDADSAGQQATWRNAQTLIACGLGVRAATMPPGEDPDSFIRKNGPEAMRALLAGAKDVFEHKALALAASLDMHNPRNHQRVVAEMAPLLALVESEPRRQRLMANIGDILRMDAGAFLAEFQRLQRRGRRAPPPEKGGTPQDVRDAEDQGMDTGDYLLRLALMDGAAARLLAGHLQEEWFDGYRLREVLFHVIRHAAAKTWRPGWEGLDMELDDTARERIAQLLMNPLPIGHREIAAGIQEAVAGARRSRLVRMQEERMEKLRDPHLADPERVRCQTELRDLKRQLLDLEHEFRHA